MPTKNKRRRKKMTKQELRTEIKMLWRKACDYDGIDAGTCSKFVCFSDDNPFLPAYNKKMELYQWVKKVERNGLW